MTVRDSYDGPTILVAFTIVHEREGSMISRAHQIWIHRMCADAYVWVTMKTSMGSKLAVPTSVRALANSVWSVLLTVIW